jgi:hypothetical protein
MKNENLTDKSFLEALAGFFNNHHDKLLCTANKNGEPSIAIMGTPRLAANGNVEFEISDRVSLTLENIMENKAVVFMAYEPGVRARDYKGTRIYAQVVEILTTGEKIDNIRNAIRAKHGEEKASELQATVSCTITRVRPVVDRGQSWNEPPFGDV